MSGSPEVSIGLPSTPEIAKPAFTMPEVKVATSPAIEGANFLTKQIATNVQPESIMKGFLQLPDTGKPDSTIPVDNPPPSDKRADYRTHMKDVLKKFKTDNPNATYQDQITVMSSQKQSWETTQGNTSNTDQGKITERKQITTQVKAEEVIPITYQTYKNEKQTTLPENKNSASSRQEAVTAEKTKEQMLSEKVKDMQHQIELLMMEIQKVQSPESRTSGEKFLQQVLLLIIQLITLTGDISLGITAAQSEQMPAGESTTHEQPSIESKPPTYTVVTAPESRQLPDLQINKQPEAIKGLLPDLQSVQGIPVEWPATKMEVPVMETVSATRSK